MNCFAAEPAGREWVAHLSEKRTGSRPTGANRPMPCAKNRKPIGSFVTCCHPHHCQTSRGLAAAFEVQFLCQTTKMQINGIPLNSQSNTYPH